MHVAISTVTRRALLASARRQAVRRAVTSDIEVGAVVRVLSVASCASGLPDEDQARLHAIAGPLRPVAAIDRYGFAWLSFDAGVSRSDLRLGPLEVDVIQRPTAAVCE